MSNPHFKLGQKVEICGKDIFGEIAYIGFTSFAPGQWIGVILKEPKGRNNGTVNDINYFSCEKNYGVFVKSNQLKKVSGATSPDSHKRQSGALTTERESGTPRFRRQQSTIEVQKPVSAESRSPTSRARNRLLPSSTITKTAAAHNSTKSSSFEKNQQEIIENMREQIQVLNDKLNTVNSLRQNDLEKFKEYDTTKIQLEQLVEFKQKIMESQAILQRELQKTKQELHDTIETKEKEVQKMNDLTEIAELTTVEKETAEEKAYMLQIELNVAKDKIEELSLDLEILKEEIDGKSTVMSSGFEFKQLQQQNDRLHKTLVQLRDMSVVEKYEQQKLNKDYNLKKSEISQLEHDNVKLSTQIKELQQQIVDLHEQVDVCLGAEEMVLTLGQQKFTLENQVQKLKEDISQLESIQNINDELIEGNSDLITELRAELEMANAATRTVEQSKEAAEKIIEDKEASLSKFRDLVENLQQENKQLKIQLKFKSTELSHLPVALEFEKHFNQSKMYCNTIDLALVKLELKQSSQHVKYLCDFMPDTFQPKHEAILLILLINQIIYKSDILLKEIHSKFPKLENVKHDDILQGYTVKQYAFKNHMVYHICGLKTVLFQYLYAFDTCTPEILLKISSNYSELLIQEKVIDGYLEYLKNDQLDENTSLKDLEHCTRFFRAKFSNLLVDNNGDLDHNHLLISHIRTLKSASEVINTYALALKAFINTDEKNIFVPYVLIMAQNIQEQLKLMKLCIPKDTSITNLGFGVEIYEILFHCCEEASKVINSLQDTVTNVISFKTEDTIPSKKILELLTVNTIKFYKQGVVHPEEKINDSLNFILVQMLQIVQFLRGKPSELIKKSTKNKQTCTAPLIILAQTFKQQLDEINHLKQQLQTKENNIQEAKQALKLKQDEYSILATRKKLTEKKLEITNKDCILAMEKYQNQFKEAERIFEEKETELMNNMKRLLADFVTLEENYKKLKIDYNTFITDQSNNNRATIVYDSPIILQEMKHLKSSLIIERNDKIRLQNQDLRTKLASLKPITTYSKQNDFKIDKMIQEAMELKQKLLMLLATPKVVDLSNRKPGTTFNYVSFQWQIEQRRFNLQMLGKRVDQVLDQVQNERIKRKFGGRIEADFACFSTKEMSLAMKEMKPISIGEIKIPLKYCNMETAQTLPVEFKYNELQRLISQILT